MSANPDKRAPGGEEPKASEPETVTAAEPSTEPGADLFVEPASATPAEAEAPAAVEAAEPAAEAAEPEPAPVPEPEPETLPERPAFRAQGRAAARPLRAPREEPAPDPAPLSSVAPTITRRAVPPQDPGAADFDAVFEARSEGGLGDRFTPTLCYILMVVSPLFLGLIALPAALIAYMNKDTAPAWIRTHFLFQIRTFWIGTMMALAAAGTFLFFDRGLLGVIFGALWALVLVFGVVWYVARAWLGLGRLRRGEALDNYRTLWV